MLERDFQRQLIRELRRRFPGCIVMKNDANYIKGIPDLLILYKNHWAALEAKRNASAKHQKLQDYYVEKLNNMSFSAFIFPENKEDVLHDMERSFEGCS